MLDEEQREQAEMQAWAKARERFLMEAFPELYSKMKNAGTLGDHLTDVGEEAFLLFNQTQGDIRARLMKDATMPLLKRANEIDQAQVVASEIVMSEIILVPPTDSDEMSLDDLSSQIASLEDELKSVVTAKPGSGLWYDQLDDKSWINMEIRQLKAELAKRQGR